MQKSCDLKININDHQLFLVNQKIISKYCGRVKKILKHEKRRKNLEIRINDFPGGPDGFEMVSRFCYNKGKFPITVANVPLLHCCAIYLGMSEEFFTNNLLQQTETFLKGIYYWKWNDILCVGAYKTENNNLVLTRFLLHYLKTATQTRGVNDRNNTEYAALADTAVYGVILVGKKSFSCRGLFWVLRIVSGFGLSIECRSELEKMIGGMLEQATLDDLLVSGHDMGVYYDVNLVIRLVRLFVDISGFDGVSLQKVKRVGRLVDKYLREISPDHNLKISKFLGVAECLPDSARDCFDGVYRAIDIYLESHPRSTFEERSRLCRCLNYNKLSFEASKDMAKSPRIPPRISMQALISQKTKIPTTEFVPESSKMNPSQIVLYNETNNTESFTQEKKDMTVINLEKMQRRVVELEKLCKEMDGHLSKLVSHRVLFNPTRSRALLRFC
uniref:Putative BTB POZ domain protein n=1 Tax=Lupinus angustifolius TaxID=3871 RepID=A0A182BFD9_LUPAN|nr:putative BTB POZ domain protein [Lupinus angustifolius]